MARTTKVSYGRTVSHDGFGNNKAWMALEVEVEDGDDPRTVMAAMHEEADVWEKIEKEKFYERGNGRVRR